MFCILPFETDFYQKLNYKVDYVGNPTVDAVHEFMQNYHTDSKDFQAQERLSDKPIMALLAGSRKQEIKDNLPTMLAVAHTFPEYQPVIAGAPGITPEYYQQYMGGNNAAIAFNQTYPLLLHSKIALVTSGTATLETALFRIPQVVCYYTPAGPLVSFVFKHFFHTPFISLVNLIGGYEIVQELFGARFSAKAIQEELGRILNNDAYREQMLSGYDKVIGILGESGASKRAASLIYNSIRPLY
jgi:lipid-A-disaccharide synthase